MADLDHISLFGDQRAFTELGFRVTPTEGSTAHARIFLDRTYFEITPPNRVQAELGARAWFLRPADPRKAADALRAAGLRAEGPHPYEGEDGNWLDVSLPEATASALPILTKRVDQPKDQWPPLLGAPHPNGATRIAELYLHARDPAPLLRLFEALNVPPLAPDTFELAGKTRIVLRPADSGPSGLVAVLIERLGGEYLGFETVPATGQVES